MSSVACPPADIELRDSIEKFAVYVARNGPASEEAVRQQHRGNPKFAFLFAGEGSDFYKYRLLYEIQNLRQAATVPFTQPPPVGMQGPSFTPNQKNFEIEEQRIEEQIKSLRNQITESESNLKAHELALNSQKQVKVEALWAAKEEKRIGDLIKQVGLNIAAFEKLIDRLQDSGSKETISNSKKWIFDNCNSDRLREIILTYLLHRVRERQSTDSFRLHVLYLINDWAHYCQRKKLDSIRQMLSRYVPKLYAYACSSPTAVSNNTFVDKLEKLVGVWEGHKYFDDGCYKQLRNPSATMLAEQAATVAEQHQLAAEVDKEIADTLGAYTKQHKEYEQHVLTKVAERESALRECRKKAEDERNRIAAELEKAEQMRRRATRFDQSIPLPPTNSPHKIPSLLEINPPPHNPTVHQTCHAAGPPTMAPPFPPLPPNGGPPPPMGHFAMPHQRQVDLIPKAPYYELPAGMMVPLIRIEDITYESLREKDLRLPPPEPPSEQLMREIDRFYTALQLPPPVDCVRDADGWEMNGLLEHYIKKREQKLKLETELKEKGKVFEDAISNRFVPPQPTKKSVSKKARSTSPPSSSSSSPSSESSSADDSSSESSSRSRSRSRSRSSSRSLSASPPHGRKSQSPTLKRRRRSRSRSHSPDDRPSFFAVPTKPAPRSVSFKVPALPINRETNRGAQLMAKMGWEGKGLGAKEQGIEEPVSGGEIRDKTDQFRGLGSKPDIYEEYRKQKSVQMAKKLGKF